jgi:hypothetical protein
MTRIAYVRTQVKSAGKLCVKIFFVALTDEDKEWISGKLEDVETKLLTAFHSWASPIEGRVRRHREGIHDLEVELELLTGRVKALEERYGKA